MSRDESGSAIVESLFGTFILLVLVLGTIQVALTLYARNVLMAAVHDGARAAVEIGTSETEASALVRRVIADSAGSLVDDLDVAVVTDVSNARYEVRVVARGYLDVTGPVPVDVPVTVQARSVREVLDASTR